MPSRQMPGRIGKSLGAAPVARPAPRMPPPPVLHQAPSNAPTAELRRRDDIEAPQVDGLAFRPGWRIQSRLDGLLADGLIRPAD
jgi:hypothetical protein